MSSRKGPASHLQDEGPFELAEDRQFATHQRVTPDVDKISALLDAISEPSLIVEGHGVRLANGPARGLLGQIENRDIRLVIRHPQALERILAHQSGFIDVTGVVDPGRSWRLVLRTLWPNAVLVRMIDRSDAVSAEKMRVDFVANASHELRTPLSTVLGYAETFAEETNLSDEQRRVFGRTIREEARRMLRIIEDLMSLSRIEADRFLAPSEWVELPEIVAASVADLSDQATRRSCELKVEIGSDLPRVRGDQGQLIQLLDNLISNALRYGCDRAGASVEIGATRAGGWVHISVADHGPGIAREHLPRITERFYRADAARSRESGGTGLGLAIVKHIVERHRGVLDIRSTLGVGTTVTVKLPIAG